MISSSFEGQEGSQSPEDKLPCVWKICDGLFLPFTKDERNAKAGI